MRDVAALAGVSLKTVSRVVNGVSTVDPEMAGKVHTAAAKLGFRPNLSASNLRRSDRRTSTIGMLVEDAGNPFSAALMRAVEDVARHRDVRVLIGSLDEDPDRERDLSRELIDRRVDGLVVVPASSDHSYLAEERDAGTALVFLDREPMHLQADAVVSDNQRGAELAVRHLLAQGHRRIGYLGDRTSISTAAQRLAGYRHALEVAHVEVDEAVVKPGLASSSAAVQAATAMLSLADPPTAIFASQNFVTIEVTRALRSMDLQSSVAMVGFDDFPLADLLSPGISVIAQDTEGMGRLAAELLFQRLDGDQQPMRTYVLPTTLIVRGSGEIPPPR
ncbi:LacI family DNA-binding transcriptional regulator [Acidothermaceae bacterium B102]|nr:LacI family DNA-binding transcriptional regulator [Acidothermaceae bacterium B102]